MADLSSITDVEISTNTVTKSVNYGATINPGDALYLDSSDGEHKPAQATSEAAAEVVGIAVTGGVDGGKGIMAVSGNIKLVGATVAAGTHYVVSAAAAGGIAPDADLGTGNYCSDVGRGTSNSGEIVLNLGASGVTHA